MRHLILVVAVGIIAGPILLQLSGGACAQSIDFGRIGNFESMGTGTLHGASPPKTLIDDSERHTVFLTIWKSNTDTKVYWKPLDGNGAQTNRHSGDRSPWISNCWRI